MEFWGVEVKAGEKLKCKPDWGRLIHISQAAMGEVKDPKGAKNVPLRMRINDTNFIIGSLSAEDRTQVMFDLVFEKEFELSHDLKNASVYFIGYIADDPVSDDEVYSDLDDESEDEELHIEAQENGTTKANALDVKPAKKEEKAGKKAKVVEKKEENDSDDESEEDSDFGIDDDMSLDGAEHDFDDSDDSDEEGEDDDSSEEEELPKEKPSKKRQAESAEKTPAAKKAKAATPEKTGKKGQNSTPAPTKSAGKKEQTPKSGVQVSCKSCSKTFTSEGALQSHSKAKHGGK